MCVCVMCGAGYEGDDPQQGVQEPSSPPPPTGRVDQGRQCSSHSHSGLIMVSLCGLIVVSQWVSLCGLIVVSLWSHTGLQWSPQ